MAGIVVTCPECEKKFRPKADVSGKRIKCPFCTHQFVVPGTPKSANGDAKSAKADKAKASAKDAKPATATASQSADPDLDKDENPYSVKNVELVPHELQHHFFEFRLSHLAMSHADANAWEHFLNHGSAMPDGIDSVVNEVNLPAASQFQLDGGLDHVRCEWSHDRVN